MPEVIRRNGSGRSLLSPLFLIVYARRGPAASWIESVSCAGIIGHSNAPPSVSVLISSPALFSRFLLLLLRFHGEIFILARIYISPSNVRSRTSPLSYSRSPRDSPLDSRGGWRGRKGEDSATLLVQGHLSEVIFAVHSRAKIAK